MNPFIPLLEQLGNLSTKEAAARLGVNVATVNRYAVPLSSHTDRAQRDPIHIAP